MPELPSNFRKETHPIPGGWVVLGVDRSHEPRQAVGPSGRRGLGGEPVAGLRELRGR